MRSCGRAKEALALHPKGMGRTRICTLLYRFLVLPVSFGGGAVSAFIVNCG